MFPGFPNIMMGVLLPQLPDASLDLNFVEGTYRTGGAASTFADAFTGTAPELTYSTASNSTMVNSSGDIVWGPHNLLPYSEQIDNAAWSKGNFGSGSLATVTANAAVAPDGNLSADKVTISRTDTTGLSFIWFSMTDDGNKKSRAFWIKASTTSDVGKTLDTWTYAGSVENREAVVLSANWQLVQLADVTLAAGTNRDALSIGYLNNGSLSPNTGSISFDIWGAHVYRSDLGGMAPVPGAVGDFQYYVPTSSSAEYLPRVGHHVYNGSTWVNEGLLIESEARTNLLLNSATLSTQSVTVAAAAHTLSFTGTGTITLSGVSTDGPLVGTGTGEGNRVSLTFTPTAGSLTLTVSGTVSNAQLEQGSTPSSYMPTSGGTYTRAAQSLTVPPAQFGWNSNAVSIQMDGRITYADEGVEEQQTLFAWGDPTATNYLVSNMDTDSTDTGEINFEQDNAGTTDTKTSDAYSPGINVPFNIASRHGSTFVNGAVDGVALTADTTPVALPDLSGTNLEIAKDFMGTIGQFRQFADDIGDAGLEQVTS